MHIVANEHQHFLLAIRLVFLRRVIRNLTVLRDNKAYRALPFYADDPEINPKQIWEAGKPIRQLEDCEGEQDYLLITPCKLLATAKNELLDKLYYSPKNKDAVY